MGGFGSGRRSHNRHNAIDGLPCLDSNIMQRQGVLVNGCHGSVEWPRSTRSLVKFCTDDQRFRLFEQGDNGQHRFLHGLLIVRVPCRYGGSRAYFSCPCVIGGKACGRRVAKLYYDGDQFLCRQCTGLSYRCQSEGPFSRNLRRSDKIRLRLGGPRSSLEPIPPRPKGMWLRTYVRLYDECRRSEQSAKAISAAILPSGPKIIETRARRRKSR